jgi:ribosomal protein S18 acetylase RimI-like enzyme
MRGLLNPGDGVVGPAAPFPLGPPGCRATTLARCYHCLPLSAWTLRPARREDLPAVLELWREANAVPSVTDDVGSLEALLHTDAEALMVADVGGEVVGSLIAAWDGWRGSFYRLAVSPGHRRQGLARALVEAGETRLRDRGARRLTAFVDAGEEPAVAFWEAVGFQAQRDRLRFVRNLG